MLDSVTNTDRRAILWAAASLGLMTSVCVSRTATAQVYGEVTGTLDGSEARKIAFDGVGHDEKVSLISSAARRMCH